MPVRVRKGLIVIVKPTTTFIAVAFSALLALPAGAAQLGQDARGAIPRDIQQLIVIDYRAMQNSPSAMQMRGKVMPPELKQLETALKTSGFDENHDVEQLIFASFRHTDNAEQTSIVGIAQGQFPIQDLTSAFRKQKLKATLVRNNRLYPMGASGMMATLLDQSTMVFGSTEAVKAALDVRDGLADSMLKNSSMVDLMKSVENEPLWSILDQKGTQFMMRSVLGQASSLTDYDTVKKRLLNSSYTMNFLNGVKFDLYVNTPDTFSAATMSSLLNAAALYTKMSGTDAEKQALDATKITSSSGELSVHFAASDGQFQTLLESPLFQNVVK